MLWKRCLILLFILLQPLRGFAEAQAAFCGFSPPPQHNEISRAAQHAHHHDVSSQSGEHAQHDQSSQHGDQHGHGKSCGSCCQACGPALAATVYDSVLSVPVAPEIHRTERTPASPVENRIRPPIA